MRWTVLCSALALAGCVEVTGAPPPASTSPAASASAPAQDARVLGAVVARVEPVAESECRRRTSGTNCDFLILIETDAGAPPNAYQSLDKNGRPVLTITATLVADTRNPDELAFILGHEAAHHIRGHIPKQQQTAVAGALLGGVLASLGGASEATIRTAQDIGATVGSRVFSKDLELEADELGTIIAARAGYDPVLGAQYFQRIPDPGDRILGTHPPNGDRLKTVQRTAAGL